MYQFRKTVLGIAMAAVLISAAAALPNGSGLDIPAAAANDTDNIAEQTENTAEQDEDFAEPDDAFDLSSSEDEDAASAGTAAPRGALSGFTIKDGVLTRYTGNGGYVLIPDTVKIIGSGAFKGNTKLTRVYIPETVTEIRSNAFKECKALTAVEMPESVITIGEKAFENCTALEKCEIGGGVISVGDSAYAGCSGMKELTIPASVENIGFCAFSGCGKLEEVVIPDSVTNIGARAFEDSVKLRELTLGGGIVSMGENAFARCSELKTVILGDGMTVIGNGAFTACEKIETIEIPDSVVSIGINAFEGCYALSTVEIGSGVESIGSNAFSKCAALREISLPAGVKTLGSSAFKYCSGIDSFSVPADVTAIGDGTFCGCSWLKTIDLPDGIETIGINAFSDCALLQEIELPDTVTTIEKYAFSGCSHLAEMEIPDSVTTIGAYAFQGCSKMTHMTVPSSVKKIGEFAFAECSELKDIDFDGTRAEWNEFTKAAGGDLGVTRRTSVNCTDGVINPKKVTGIKVKTAPVIHEYYIKQTIIIDGGEITVTYSNGDTEVLDMTLEMVEGSLVMTEVGEQAVVLRYENCFTNFKVLVKDYPKLEMDNKSYDTFADVFSEIGTNTGTYTLTLNEDIEVTKFTLPKNADLIIKGNRHTIKFVGLTNITGTAALTLENVRLESKNKNGADAALTITNTTKDITLDDLLFTGTELNIKGGAKNTLRIGKSDAISNITSFSAVVLTDAVELKTTLSTTNMRLGENCELLIDEGAAVTVKGVLRAEEGAVIELVKGFKPITLGGTAEGEPGSISLVSVDTLEDQQIFKTKIADLSIFDYSGIIPDPEDGDYEFKYYVVSDKVYIKAYNIGLATDDYENTFATWKDMLAAITKLNVKTNDYTVTLLGNVDIGGALTLPSKLKCASFSVEGAGTKLTFTGTSLSVAGNVSFSGIILAPMKSGKAAATYKLSVSKGGNLDLTDVSSETLFTYKAATGGYINGEVEKII